MFPPSLKLLLKSICSVLFVGYSTSIHSQQFFNFTSPSSNSSWERGTRVSVQWTEAEDIGGFVKLELYKGTTMVYEIHEQTNNDGRYDFDLPDYSSIGVGNNYRVKASHTTEQYFGYSEYFDITEGIIDQISVFIPDENTTWNAGQQDVVIEWEYDVLPSHHSVDVLLYKDNQFYQTIRNGTPNDGYYEWDVPENIEDDNNYQVKVFYDEINEDKSERFSISGVSSIEITEPNENTTWETGQQDVTISWETGNIPGNVSIELFKGNDKAATIKSEVSNNGLSNNWDVPESLEEGDDYKVKITPLEAGYENRSEYSNIFGLFSNNQNQIEFTQHNIADIGLGLNSISIADLDLDGYLDIVCVDHTKEELVLFKNNQGNGYSFHLLDDNLFGVTAVSTADFDGDGYSEIVISDQGKCYYYKNENGANLIRTQILDDNIFKSVRELSSIDIDVDGDLDIIIADVGYQSNHLAWLENDGAGDFNFNLIESGSSLKGVAAGDVDNDEDVDIASAGPSNAFSLYSNNGNGTYTKQIIYSGAPVANSPISISLVDLDKDGFNDLVGASNSGETYSWFQNEGNGNFIIHIIDQATINTRGASDIDIADLDGDGQLDVIAASAGSSLNGFGDGRISWYKRNSENSFESKIIGLISVADVVKVADLDGDGDIDIIAGSGYNGIRNENGKLIWYENQLISQSEPNLETSLSTIDFGEHALQDSTTESFTLTNIGTADLLISEMSVEGVASSDFFIDQTLELPISLSPSESVEVSVVFIPETEGLREATLIIKSNDLESSHSVALVGTGIVNETPILSITPLQLDYGQMKLGESKSIDLTFSNDGEADLWIYNFPDFGVISTIIYTGTPKKISPGSKWTISLGFNASEVGAVSSEMVVSTNLEESPHLIPITATVIDEENFLELGGMTFYFDEKSEGTNNDVILSGNVNINSVLWFKHDVVIRFDDKKIVSIDGFYLKDIAGFGEVDLYDGYLFLDYSEDLAELSKVTLDEDRQHLELAGMPISIETIRIIDDGIEIDGQIQFPDVLGAISSEIDQIRLTRSEGLDVAGLVELIQEVKIHKAVSLKELSFEFDTDQNKFQGSGIIGTSLFEASAGVYIVEKGLDSVGVWVDLANPKPLGTTGLALAGAGGYVDGIQVPPLRIGLGTTLVPVGSPPEFISFESLSLEYQLGTSMIGSGNFVLFNQALANAYFEIEKERIALGVDVNFQDILVAYMSASIAKNQSDGIDFIGKFSGELQIPNRDGFEYRLYEALLRKALKDESLTLPITLAGTDNVIFNSELTGKAWIVRPGKKEFKISYLLEYKNGEIKTDFAKGFRLFNEEVFNSSTNGRQQLEYLSEVHPESRFEGHSLVLKGDPDSNGRTKQMQSVDQDFTISSEVESIVIRVKGESTTPVFKLIDPNRNEINQSSGLQNYQYLSNAEDNSVFMIVDFPIIGTFTISIEDTGDNYLVDVIGNEGEPGFMINEINETEGMINIKWSDENQYDNGKISFYYDDDNKGADGKPIELGISEDDETDNIDWIASNEIPGSYYIYGIMTDTLGNLVVDYFESPVSFSSSISSPSNLNYSIDNDTLYLDWDKSVDCSGCDNLIFIGESENISNSTPNQNVGDTISYALFNLDFGRTYFLSIASRNEDGVLSSFSNIVEVELISQTGNNLPIIRSVDSPESVRKGVDITMTFDLFDADQDNLTLEAIHAPENIEISSNTINWTALTVGEKQFFIKVSDQEGYGDSIRFFIEVFEEVFLSPSLSSDKGRMTEYGESVNITLRDPYLKGQSANIFVIAKTKESEESAIELAITDSESGLFTGSVSLDRQSNPQSRTLRVSRTDTLILSYSSQEEEIYYNVIFDGPNTAPENLDISSTIVLENENGAFIGKLSSSDFDNDDLQYEISSSLDEFIIVDDSLKSNIEFNFEEQSSYNLTVSASDGFDEITKDFTISVIDINEAPTDLFISSDTISENRAAGTLIGILTTEDEDGDESFTYSYTGDLFEIAVDQLLSKLEFDFEESESQTVEIITTDRGGLSLSKTFDITILDVEGDVLGLGKLNEEVFVYPNPAKDYIIVKWGNFKSAILSEISGKELFRSNSRTLDLRTLKEGVYLLTLNGVNRNQISFRVRKK